MKKITTLLLTSTCALVIINNSFGMFAKTSPTRTITHKKIRPFCANNKELPLQRVQVVRRRQQIKERNNILKKNNDILMACITEQNKVIDQIEEWNNKPRTQFELQIAFYEMTGYAQKLLELEQQKENLLS